LSLAIGREGQNVRLAARLTGWRLDIASESEAAEARERYMAERAEAQGISEPAPSEEPTALAEEAVAQEEAGMAPAGIDEELIRKLEEFKRERLGGDE
jgi:N utilization substance protein A